MFNIFKQEVLTDVEQDIILDIFSNDVVKKYLRIMAQNDIEELASLPVSSIADSEVGKKHALVQGKLSTLVTLIKISKPKE